MDESVKVRFSYEIHPRKSGEMFVDDFDGCETFEELMNELYEQAPDGELSVVPDQDDARKLWDLVQARRKAA